VLIATLRPLRIPEPPLLLVTDRRQARRPLEEIVSAAIAAGCRWISVREKDLPADEQALLVRRLLPLARAAGARLLVHGEAELARLADADGVHLPSGADAAAARARLGRDKLIGISVHTVGDAAGIVPAHVDYALAGPAFETPSKPGYGPEIGHRGLAEIARAAPMPILAIGGVNALRVPELIGAGAAGVAVMGSIMRAADPATEVRGLIAALTGARAACA
jgi:thiamine-phosphate pyrophosphorylase